jgi:transposase
MYGPGRYLLQGIPEDAVISGYNHSLNRKGRPKSMVKLTLRRDVHKQQIRKETVEHPFGTIKWYDGAHYFLCRGKEKVAAESALSFLGYNIRRAIKVTTGENSPVPGILMFLKTKIRAKWA